MRQSMVLVLGTLLALGCSSPKAAPRAANHTHDPSDHNHDRGHMMLATDGRIDGLLTSHLSSKSGNELDIFVEYGGRPRALPTTRVTGHAITERGKVPLTFECAPAEERPKDEAAGTCSHFVALAHWMEADAALRVEGELTAADGPTTLVWRSFVPRRYAHHVE